MPKKTSKSESTKSWWPFGSKKSGEKKEPEPPRDNFRETVESVVIAFVLAFLFRTFEAEAFVIPTGSMAPTLLGRNRDLAGRHACEKCGYHYFVGASDEVQNDTGVAVTQRTRDENGRYILGPDGKNFLTEPVSIANATCPICRWTMDISPDNPQDETYHSYSGDRILVSKFDYAVHEPERWDIVVFKYPKGAQTNYIKRLIGLPNEQVMIRQGDIYTRPIDPEKAAQVKRIHEISLAKYPSEKEIAELERLHIEIGQRGVGAGEYQIAQKEPAKLQAMMQIVHDTEYELTKAERNGWPVRWGADYETDKTAWKTEEDGRLFELEEPKSETAWLYYRHFTKTYNEWRNPPKTQSKRDYKPRLITDFAAYNTGLVYRQNPPLPPVPAPASAVGQHWVGDLMVESNVAVTQHDNGQITLQLVRAGERFQCRFDLAKGTAGLYRDNVELATCPNTGVRETGEWELAMANVDRKIVVWVDGSVLSFEHDGEQFDEGVSYIADIPSQPRPLDLKPVAIGFRNAAGRAEQLRVWRDIYYLAINFSEAEFLPSANVPPIGSTIRHPATDMYTDDQARKSSQIANDQDRWARFLENPQRWTAYTKTNKLTFALAADEFLMLGDNTSKSQDSRYWGHGDTTDHVVERKLLIGKALFIYWPHTWETSWHSTYNLGPLGEWYFPFYPNFGRMRLIR